MFIVYTVYSTGQEQHKIYMYILKYSGQTKTGENFIHARYTDLFVVESVYHFFIYLQKEVIISCDQWYAFHK